MADRAITVKFSESALDELGRCKTEDERRAKILEFMNEEVQFVNEWADRELGGPGQKFENAWLRTYLYTRLIRGGSVDDLPQEELEEHPAMTG